MGTQIKAEIVAHSINEQGDELISILATFPRIILAEVNTHRMLSKNTSSSRAIPFKKMVESVENDPFIPIAWQKEHKGMQGSEYLTDKHDIEVSLLGWLEAKEEAIDKAKYLNNCGVTKQLCNRLLEPFMWTTMLITGSREGWENFFKLRCPQYTLNNDDIFRSKKDFKTFYKEATEVVENHLALPLFAEDVDTVAWLKANKGQAEIHMMAFAEAVWDSVNESIPEHLEAGQWHIPFRSTFDIEKISSKSFRTYHTKLKATNSTFNQVKISVAMAARTSYTVVGEEKEINYEAMIGLHDRLLAQDPPHSSPLEHCARCMSKEEYQTFLKGVIQDQGCELEQYEEGYSQDVYIPLVTQGWCNNFKGFIPYRYMVDNGNQEAKN